MDDKIFDSYQKRILNAMDTPNLESNDPFTQLFKILGNLKKYVSNGHFSLSGFKSEIENQFNFVDTSNQVANHFKKTLLKCTTKTDALKTLTDLYDMVKPISLQVGSWSSIANIAEEYMAEIEKSIFHSN